MALDVETALVAKLNSTAGVTTLSGSRVHPLTLPPTATLPAITYSQVSAPTEGSHDLSSTNVLTHARYQLDAWAGSYSTAVALGQAVYAALEGYRGTITSGSDTFSIQACQRSDKRTNVDAETGLSWLSQDFVIWY